MIQGLLLAAGRARRFGSDKLAARLPDGRPVAVASAQALQAAVDRLLAVVRDAESPGARALRAAGVEISVCPRADRGLGASLAWGVARCPDADGWLVGLADMPWLDAESARAVAEALRAGAPLARPCHRGRDGHPVGFGRELGAALRDLAPERGACRLVERHAGRLRRIPVEDPGVVRDLDRPGDL